MLESLRLRPPAYMVGRCASHDDNLASYSVRQGEALSSAADTLMLLMHDPLFKTTAKMRRQTRRNVSHCSRHLEVTDAQPQAPEASLLDVARKNPLALANIAANACSNVGMQKPRTSPDTTAERRRIPLACAITASYPDLMTQHQATIAEKTGTNMTQRCKMVSSICSGTTSCVRVCCRHYYFGQPVRHA